MAKKIGVKKPMPYGNQKPGEKSAPPARQHPKGKKKMGKC